MPEREAKRSSAPTASSRQMDEPAITTGRSARDRSASASSSFAGSPGERASVR